MDKHNVWVKIKVLAENKQAAEQWVDTIISAGARAVKESSQDSIKAQLYSWALKK